MQEPIAWIESDFEVGFYNQSRMFFNNIVCLIVTKLGVPAKQVEARARVILTEGSQTILKEVNYRLLLQFPSCIRFFPQTSRGSSVSQNGLPLQVPTNKHQHNKLIVEFYW